MTFWAPDPPMAMWKRAVGLASVPLGYSVWLGGVVVLSVWWVRGIVWLGEWAWTVSL